MKVISKYEEFFPKAKLIFFFQIFFHKCKLCIFWELVYTKNYCNPTRLFVLVANQYAPGLNRGLSSNIWLLRSAKNVKFTEKSVKCMEKHVFVEKCL